MVNPFRASRQFERAFNVDVNASREDHMNLEELSRHTPAETVIQDKDATLIATIVYKPKEQKIEYVRDQTQRVEKFYT
ncbi:hypothetical protein KAR91_12480 [Candidatus Pacearchaeota archaeon]|nr:hypothetical protein [Candidatus Pacearchaeota archaeon]